MPPKRRAPAKPKCNFHCCQLSEETVQRIKESTEAGRGRSMFDDAAAFGPMCRCGVPRKPPGLAKYVKDDGMCVVHPDKPPQSWTRGAESYEPD